MKALNRALAQVLEQEAEVSWLITSRVEDRCVLFNRARSLVALPERLTSKEERWALIQCLTELSWTTGRTRNSRCHRVWLGGNCEQWRENRMGREDLYRACPLGQIAQLYYTGCQTAEMSDLLNVPEWVVAKAIELYRQRGQLRVYESGVDEPTD